MPKHFRFETMICAARASGELRDGDAQYVMDLFGRSDKPRRKAMRSAAYWLNLYCVELRRGMAKPDGTWPQDTPTDLRAKREHDTLTKLAKRLRVFAK